MNQQKPKVNFKPMTTSEYEAWLSPTIESYAEDLLQSGFSTKAKSIKKAETQFSQMLKDGIETENHDLYIVQDADSGERVGTLWIMYQADEVKKLCFIADIAIDETCRRQGYGRATMMHCETVAKAENAQSIRLHVFGFNTPAVSLYTGIGYAVISQQMEKMLD